MFVDLPRDAREFLDWPWEQIEPYYQDLGERSVTEDTLATWLEDWTRLTDLVNETFARLYVAISQDTTDEDAEARYHAFLEEIFPRAESADQTLKRKLLESGLEPEGFAVPLQKIRAEADLFREENLPLLTRERKLASEYNKIIGAQTIAWDGEEYTLTQLKPRYQAADRTTRERIWRQASDRRLADRGAINDLWKEFMDVRRKLAENAGRDDYRAYRWQDMLRFDYTPDDCLSFHDAIEEVVVPAASRVYERRRERMGVDSLRPWDLDLELGVYTFYMPPLEPFETGAELERSAARIFHQVDSALGGYFEQMRREGLLDLDNRKGKSPGGYCITFPVAERPFIFMNAVGVHDDVQTMLHESGHAFHVFERNHLPYAPQRQVGAEFSEVASMAMELLSAPYLEEREGGFYAPEDANRARAEHLEKVLLFWPYMAVVDAFQHWVYTHPGKASDPEHCDEQWAALWDRFHPTVDWRGQDDARETGWHRKLHIHRYPFYYIEYGLAQLGSVQVWRNALQDQSAAVDRYRQALALGGTAPLPELYRAAGARLAFDAGTLGEAVALIEDTLIELEAA